MHAPGATTQPPCCKSLAACAFGLGWICSNSPVLHYRYGEDSNDDVANVGFERLDQLKYGGANVYIRNFFLCRTSISDMRCSAYSFTRVLVYSCTRLLACLFSQSPPCAHSGHACWFRPAFTCYHDDKDKGGGWALVRQVKKGGVWHQARDDLKGAAAYNIAETKPTADSSFSIPYNTLLMQSTEFLFVLGMVGWESSNCRAQLIDRDWWNLCDLTKVHSRFTNKYRLIFSSLM